MTTTEVYSHFYNTKQTGLESRTEYAYTKTTNSFNVGIYEYSKNKKDCNIKNEKQQFNEEKYKKIN